MISEFEKHFMIKENISNESNKIDKLRNIELARKLVISILNKININNYLIKYNDQISEIEIIPVIGNALELNVLDKFKKHSYIFWKKLFKRKVTIDPNTILSIYRAYQESVGCSVQQEKAPYKFFKEQITYVNINKLIFLLTKRFPYLFNIEKLNIPNSLVVKFSACPFDDPKIVYNQLVLETNHFNLLANIGPYGKYHFLITPKISIDNHYHHRHNYQVESWEFLDIHQKIEAYQLCLDLSEIIKHCTKLNSIFFLHNGASAGQTVPHTHVHVLTIPDQHEYVAKIAKDIINFNRNENDINLDYVNKLRYEVGSILYQHRAMNRSPVTLLLSLKNIDNLNHSKKSVKITF